MKHLESIVVTDKEQAKVVANQNGLVKKKHGHVHKTYNGRYKIVSQKGKPLVV